MKRVVFMNPKTTVAKICYTALFAALTCVATIIIRIPSPLGGYINFGDCILLVGAWVLGPAGGFAAGATGSALADLFSGYAAYAPATFLIKGVMALAAAYAAKLIPVRFSKVIGAIIAEIIMVGGYYIFESFVLGYGAGASLVNIPYNAIQGVLGVIGGVLLFTAVSKVFRHENM